MPIVGSKLVVREAGWSSNSNREDNPENRSAYASGPFDLKRPEESLKVGQREVPRLAQGIVEALVRAKERGVDVRLIADRTTPCERESGIEPLAAAGVPVWIDAQARVAHAKAMVIDGAVTLSRHRSTTPPERAGRLLAAFPDAAVLVTRPDGSRHELSEGGKF
jgi:hypothetical protein